MADHQHISDTYAAILKHNPNLRPPTTSIMPSGTLPFAQDKLIDRTAVCQEQLLLICEYLKTIPILCEMCGNGDYSSLWSLARDIRISEHKAKETIFHKGQLSSHIYFVISGTVCSFVPKSLREIEIDNIATTMNPAEDLLRTSVQAARYFRESTAREDGRSICLFKVAQKLSEKACFGESIMSKEQRYHETVVADSERVVLAMIHQEDFDSAFPLEASKRMFIRSSLMRHFQPAVSDKILSSLSVKLKEMHFDRRSKFTGKTQSIWLLYKGTVSMVPSRGSRRNAAVRINEGEFFGHENFASQKNEEFEYIVHQQDTIAFELPKEILAFEEKYHPLLEYMSARGKDRAERLRMQISANQQKSEGDDNDGDEMKEESKMTVESLQAELTALKARISVGILRQQFNKFPFVPLMKVDDKRVKIAVAKKLTGVRSSIERNSRDTSQSNINQSYRDSSQTYVKRVYNDVVSKQQQQQQLQQQQQPETSSIPMVRIMSRTRSLHEDSARAIAAAVVAYGKNRKSTEPVKFERLSPEFRRGQYLQTQKERQTVLQSQLNSLFLGKQGNKRKGTQSTDVSPTRKEDELSTNRSTKILSSRCSSRDREIYSMSTQSSPKKREQYPLSVQGSPKKRVYGYPTISFSTYCSQDVSQSTTKQQRLLTDSGAKLGNDDDEFESKRSHITSRKSSNTNSCSTNSSILSQKLRGGRTTQGSLESLGTFSERLRMNQKQVLRNNILTVFKQVKQGGKQSPNEVNNNTIGLSLNATTIMQ